MMIIIKKINFSSLLCFAEGGRLQSELRYAAEVLGEATSSTHQLVIQTPNDAGANILHPSALKEHLRVLEIATNVTVYLFDM